MKKKKEEEKNLKKSWKCLLLAPRWSSNGNVGGERVLKIQKLQQDCKCPKETKQATVEATEQKSHLPAVSPPARGDGGAGGGGVQLVGGENFNLKQTKLLQQQTQMLLVVVYSLARRCGFLIGTEGLGWRRRY